MGIAQPAWTYYFCCRTSFLKYMKHTYRKTAHGTIRYCSNCKAYHLEFGNIRFDFTPSDLQIFRDYLEGIDGELQQEKNRQSNGFRKIVLPTQLKGTAFCFHLHELAELKYLLQVGQPEKLLFAQIAYEFSMN